MAKKKNKQKTERYRRIIRNNIKRARKKAGLTQEEVALKSKLGRTQIVRLESGKANPTPGTLIDLAKALGVAAMEFLRGV